MGPTPTTHGSVGVLYERDTVPPYVRVLPAAAKLPEEQLVPTVIDPRFPVSGVVVFPESASVTPAQIRAGGPDTTSVRARLSEWKPGSMRVTLPGATPRRRYLLVSENWYKDWHALVDGRPAPVLRGDQALITVALPPGAREVALDFDSPEYARGKLISLVALLAIVGLWAWTLVQRRRTAQWLSVHWWCCRPTTRAVNLPSIVPPDPGTGSPDRSADRGRQLARRHRAARRRAGRGGSRGCTCCTGAEKAGLGKAYLAGFRWALERGYDVVFEMDADFCHDPKFLADLLRRCRGGATSSIGSRYKAGVNVINWPISRLLLSIGANQYARWSRACRSPTRPAASSASAGRCSRRSTFDRVRSNGYSFQIEMSFRAWKKGFRLVEMPIVFTDRVEGQSKMNKRIVREAIWMVWWLRLRSLVGQL